MALVNVKCESSSLLNHLQDFYLKKLHTLVVHGANFENMQLLDDEELPALKHLELRFVVLTASCFDDEALSPNWYASCSDQHPPPWPATKLSSS